MRASWWTSDAGRSATLTIQRNDEDALTRAIIALASQYGRYGYRRITALQEAGWPVGKDRVQRIWRREGLKVPAEAEAARPTVAQRWLLRAAAAGTSESRLELRFCERFHPRRKDGAILDADRRIYAESVWRSMWRRRINSYQVIETLADVMLEHGIPDHIRSDNGPEFLAKALRNWLAQNGSPDSVHRAWHSVGERLLRKLQRQIAR